MTILKSKEAVRGLKIKFLYDYSKLRFVIDKVTKEYIWFVNIETGQLHQQSVTAFETSRFVKI